MANLRDLGLSEYEARAYRSLLKTGPTTAKELSRVSDVPMGRIYDVLNSIEQYNLVRSQSASRPKKYVAVEPETALDRESSFAVVAPVWSSDRYARDSYSERPRSLRLAITGTVSLPRYKLTGCLLERQSSGGRRQ